MANKEPIKSRTWRRERTRMVVHAQVKRTAILKSGKKHKMMLRFSALTAGNGMNRPEAG